MQFKGIRRGDSTFRHFTFDDQDVMVKGGITYYKANYGKNKLEGEYAEEEIVPIPCDQVMVLGGKKPNPPKSQVREEVVEPNVEISKPKRGRPRKETPELQSPAPSFVYSGDVKFEYYIEELYAEHAGELQNKLNELGNEGWEMCGYTSDRKTSVNSIKLYVYMKSSESSRRG